VHLARPEEANERISVGPFVFDEEEHDLIVDATELRATIMKNACASKVCAPPYIEHGIAWD